MDTSRLLAISPLDGRYFEKLKPLGALVSESALIGFRIRVEAGWLAHLAAHPQVGPVVNLSKPVRDLVQKLANQVPEHAAARVKEIEEETNHDVKAVEYYLQEILKTAGASDRELAFLHFGCTSEDINNIAYAMMLREARSKVILPGMQKILEKIKGLVADTAALPMLSRTHGQAATPTTLGKELAVFGFRLMRQYGQLRNQDIMAKMNGAVGNFNAHKIAFPEVNWRTLSREFIENLGFAVNPLTTQIESHDGMSEYLDNLGRTATILLGLCRDMWGYISLGYFAQNVVATEVGSSTMPHKVNPIDFENAEGNFGIAVAMAQHFTQKLPISRFQRDLSDSTTQRALGEFFGHLCLALTSLEKGLGKVRPVPEVLKHDLADRWEVLGEAVQTVMRRYGAHDAYEQLKAATRGQALSETAYLQFVDQCRILPEAERKRLSALTPTTYTGLAADLAREFLEFNDATF